MVEISEQRSVFALARQFAGLLDQSRVDLQRLSNLHPDFVDDCLAAVDAKKQRLHGPLLGEMFPHLVAQGLALDDWDRRMLAAAWLALYGHVCILDYELDQKGFLSGRASIAASALLAWGLATVSRYTSGTPYADAFLDNVSRAFAGQYEDIRVRADAGADRSRIDVEKNRAPLVLLSGYCAAAGEPDDRLLRAAEPLLSVFQLLDDLEDVQEDLEENNLTAFVRMVRERAHASAQLNRAEVYRFVIADPRSPEVLKAAVRAVEQSLLMLDRERDRVLTDYLADLRSRMLSAIEALESYQQGGAAIGEPEVMRRIEQIATSC